MSPLEQKLNNLNDLRNEVASEIDVTYRSTKSYYVIVSMYLARRQTKKHVNVLKKNWYISIKFLFGRSNSIFSGDIYSFEQKIITIFRRYIFKDKSINYM